jgi:hypothetical protein
MAGDCGVPHDRELLSVKLHGQDLCLCKFVGSSPPSTRSCGTCHRPSQRVCRSKHGYSKQSQGMSSDIGLWVEQAPSCSHLTNCGSEHTPFVRQCSKTQPVTPIPHEPTREPRRYTRWCGRATESVLRRHLADAGRRTSLRSSLVNQKKPPNLSSALRLGSSRTSQGRAGS